MQISTYLAMDMLPKGVSGKWGDEVSSDHYSLIGAGLYKIKILWSI